MDSGQLQKIPLTLDEKLTLNFFNKYYGALHLFKGLISFNNYKYFAALLLTNYLYSKNEQIFRSTDPLMEECL